MKFRPREQGPDNVLIRSGRMYSEMYGRMKIRPRERGYAMYLPRFV